MARGGSLKLAFLFVFAFPLLSKADQDYLRLLKCSAEFNARAEYNRGLQLTNGAHQKFLRDRSDLFLRMAEDRAPFQSIPCSNDGYFPYLGLVMCMGPASLSSQLRVLTGVRLTEIVAATGGSGNLWTCMEDEPCTTCQKMLEEASNLNKP